MPVIKASAAPAINAIVFDGDVEIRASEGSRRRPRFQVHAYNGGKLRTPAYMEKFGQPVVIDLSGVEFSRSITANLYHDQKMIVGHGKGETDGRTLSISGIVSGTGQAAQEFLGNGQNGYPWQASVEAMPLAPLQPIAAGQSIEVNGQRLDGPFLLSRKTEIRGIAFLARGADTDTSVTIAAAAASTGGNSMNPEFVKWLAEQGIADPNSLKPDMLSFLQAAYDELMKEGKPPAEGGGHPGAAGSGAPMPMAAGAFDADDIKGAHSDHLANLEAIFAEHEDEVKADAFAKIRSGATKRAKELKATALKERWMQAKYEAELIKAAANVEVELVRAERPEGPMIRSTSRPKADGLVIEAALAQTLGLPKIEKFYDDKTLQAAHTEFRGRVGLQQILIMAAAANGYDCRPGERVSDGNLRQILRYAFPAIEAANFSYANLSSTLSNIANKELVSGYEEIDETWKEISDVKSVGDFKTTTVHRMLDNFEYELLGPGAEIKHGTLGEETYTRKAKTYAKMFSLTREDIINDDLGALEDVRTRLAKGAKKKFLNIFWAAFMDNSSFFTTGRTNYITGSTTTLLSDGVGLQLGITAYRKMTTPAADGTKRIGANLTAPSKLLVPPELEFAAQRLYQSTNVVSGNTADNGVPSTNIHANKYRPVVQNRLSDSAFTGYSTTAWYLLGEDYKPMAVSFLNGKQTPTVESADADFNVLGIQFRGYHDFGCDQAEYLCGVKSKGAA